MPRRQPGAYLRPGRHPIRRPVHRHRHAGGDGLLVHEHHSGGDSRRRFRHRLSVAEILDAVADEPHLRRAADDLLARIRVRPHLLLSCGAYARALHVVRRRDVMRRVDGPDQRQPRRVAMPAKTTMIAAVAIAAAALAMPAGAQTALKMTL